MFNGYKEASEIDNLISELIEAHGITKDNSPYWMTFSRTLRTSLDLINGKLVALPKVCPRCNGQGEIQ